MEVHLLWNGREVRIRGRRRVGVKSNFGPAGESGQRLAGACETYRKLQVEVYECMKLKERLIRGFAID